MLTQRQHFSGLFRIVDRAQRCVLNELEETLFGKLAFVFDVVNGKPKALPLLARVINQILNTFIVLRYLHAGNKVVEVGLEEQIDLLGYRRLVE